MLFFERILLQVKGMGVMFMVPFAGYYIAVPLGVWALSGNSGFVLSDAIAEISYLVVPFMSTWWIYLVVKEYIEGDGCEILLLEKGIFLNVIFYEIFNVLSFLPLFFVKIDLLFYQDILYLFEQLVIITFFMGGLTFFLCFFLKSVTVSMLVVIIYSAVSNFRFSNEKFENILGCIQLIRLKEVPYDGNYGVYEQFIIMGIVFWIIGMIKSKKGC